jgi:hypothetical protein
MAEPSERQFLGTKRMKRLAFVLTGAAALTLGACNNNNQDAVNNAEMNQPAADLNALSSDAANDAANAEAAALGNQQQQLENENTNTSNPSDDQEQNVSGM